ncbi:MAG TPA: CopY/TcrY family copper transport repressor [Clostridiales bacterium]|nr:CopY/TcrY family copper transport repressor [Clostridiales bacterium]
MEYNISEAEWEVMRTLWECGEPMTSAEIVARVEDLRGRSPRTIKTLLQRLVAKGFVTFTIDAADSRVYHYSAAVSEDICVKRENHDFVSLYYKGDVAGMLARFIGDSELSRDQIEALTALLAEKKEDAP